MIIGFTILIIIIIVLAILNIKAFTNQKLYKKKYNDLDKTCKEVVNRQRKAIDEKIIKYKELDELYEQKVIEIDKLEQQLKQYKENHTHFIKEVPMKSLAFKTEIVVSRDLRNDKDYMKVIDGAACNKLAEAILESEAYEVTEEFDAYYNQYKRRYVFRFFK
jgi:hypothetical protein